MKKIVDNKNNRILIVVITPLILVTLLLLYMVIKSKFGISIECQTKVLLGIDCAGCGVTRMIESMLNLDFYQAFRWNPMIFVSLPFILIFYIWQSIAFIKYASLSSKADKLLIIYFIILMIFGILRNIEFFSWLAPTEV